MVDHRQLGPVVTADVSRFAFVEKATAASADHIGRPDEPIALPRFVGVAVGPLGRGVEWFVRVELVDEQQPPLVVTRVRSGIGQPCRSGTHRLRTREIVLRAEVRSGAVVGPVDDGCQIAETPLPEPRRFARRWRRNTDPRWVEPCLPRVALVATHVIPSAEVGVVVLATCLEQMGMIGDQHGGDAGIAQIGRDRSFPRFDRAPGSPQEVEGATENVVARGHAGQRPGDMAGEAGGTLCEAVEVRCGELGAAIAAEHVPIQRVEQYHHHVAWCGRRARSIRCGHSAKPVISTQRRWHLWRPAPREPAPRRETGRGRGSGAAAARRAGRRTTPAGRQPRR